MTKQSSTPNKKVVKSSAAEPAPPTEQDTIRKRVPSKSNTTSTSKQVTTKPHVYDEKSIQVLKGLDAVRKRPAMYLGLKGDSMLYRMLKEIVDNAYDEALSGRNKSIEVVIDSTKNQFIVKDGAQGIPVGIHEKEGISTLEVVMTYLHAGGKFNNLNYKHAAGCFTADTSVQLVNFNNGVKYLEFISLLQCYESQDYMDNPINTYSFEYEEGVGYQYKPNIITEVQFAKYVTKLAHVTLKSGQVIKCTVDHPFYTLPNLSYPPLTEDDVQLVAAENLQPGTVLFSNYSPDYPLSIVTSVSVNTCPIPEPVFGLTAHPNNNFSILPGLFVGNTHGVGVSATNALSKNLKVWTWREGKCYHQSYVKGVPQATVREGKIDAAIQTKLHDKSKNGTVIFFEPDQDIISADGSTPAKTNRTQILTWLKYLAMLQTGLTVTVSYDDKKYKFLNTIGPEMLLQQREKTLKVAREGRAFVFENPDCVCTFAFSDYSDDDGIQSFVCSSPTKNGGTHVKGMVNVIVKALTAHASKKDKYTAKDLLHGLIGVLNYKMSEPEFTSQTKDELDSNVTKDVEALLLEPVTAFFTKNKKLARTIIKRAVAVSAGREQYKKVLKSISDVKKSSRKTLLPNVLASAVKARPDKRELYLVEGDSSHGCHVNFVEVLLADGSTKSFAQLVEDEKNGIKNVGIAYDIEHNAHVPFEFEEPRIVTHATEYTELVLSDGTIWQGTHSHPWLLTDGTYKAACELVNGDDIQTIEYESNISVVSKNTVNSETPVPMYDATSPTYHNLVLANGCVVHNTCKKARDAAYQEVLKLKGKPVNSMKAKMEDVLSHEVIQNLLIALDVDVDSQKKKQSEFDVSSLRVRDVYLLADGDEDGPWHPDTRVLTCDGSNPTIKELSEEYARTKKAIPVYGYNEIGLMVEVDAYEPKVYQTVTSMAHITLDNGHVLRCTPDHKLMPNSYIEDTRIIPYRGQLYVRAKDLVFGDSLKSTYFEVPRNSKRKPSSDNVEVALKKATDRAIYRDYFQAVMKSRKLKGRKRERVIDRNHKVIAVHILPCEPTDMYCLTVPETGNFLVEDGFGNGIGSANCHINLLMLAFFYRFMPQLIIEGRLRVIDAPLFFGFYKNKRYIGSTFQDCYKQMPKGAPKHCVIRAKGYGEVSHEALAEVAFNPKTRSYITLTYPKVKEMLQRYEDIVGKSTSLRKEILEL